MNGFDSLNFLFMAYRSRLQCHSGSLQKILCSVASYAGYIRAQLISSFLAYFTIV